MASAFTIVQHAKSTASGAATFASPTTAGNAIVAYWGAFGHGPGFSPPAPGAPTACNDDAVPSSDAFALFSQNYPDFETTEVIWVALDIIGGATTVSFSGATFVETGGPTVIIAEVSCPIAFMAWGVGGSADVTVVGGGIDQRPNGSPVAIQFAAGQSTTAIRTTTVLPALDSGDPSAFNSNNAVALITTGEIFVIYSDYNESTPPVWTSSNGTVIDSTNQSDGLTGVLAWASFPFLIGSGCTGGSPPALDIQCGSPPDGTVGAFYTHTFPVEFGAPPYTFSITAGSIPTGLTLSTSTGVISGIPTAANTFSFTIQVEDALTATANVSCSITITAGALAIQCNNPPPGQVGVSYSHAITASGGTAPYTFVLTVGPLPPGLSMASTGLITGTPTAIGTYPFTVRVTDNVSATASVQCSITINCPSASASFY